MPNPSQIQKTAERRAARAGKKAEHEQAAVTQEHELAALSDRLRGKTTPPTDVEKARDADAKLNEAGLRVDQIGLAEPVVDSDPEDAPVKAKAGTRASQKQTAQLAAEKQAEADLQATVNPLPEHDEHDLSYYRSTNTEPPLHVLNAIARRADDAVKDDARVAAQAAGKAAYEALTEHRDSRSPESRHKTMEKAMRDAAAAKSQVGAADAQK
jgi:hypothetical protein